jgi:glycosyltransferase involved in cell wall biosynthesis
MQMRILLITHFFPPHHNAGTENYTLGLAKSLRSKGHDVCVLCAEEWGSGDSYWNGATDETYQGVPVKRVYLNWVMAKDPNRVLYYSYEMKTWLSQLLEKEPFDIAHILSAYSFGVGILESVKAARIPLILTLMDFWFLCPSVQLLRSDGELCDGLTTALQCQSCLMADSGVSQKITKFGISPELQLRLWGPLSRLHILTKQRGFRGKLLNMDERKQLLKNAIELPDLVLSHSRTVKEIFSLHTERKIEVLQNGHDLSWLKTYKGKTPRDKLSVGYVGQIISIKGVHVLVEAFKKANLGKKATLEIWGGLEKDPSYVADLKALMEGEPSISLNGRFLHDDLAEVFSNIDILVIPSTWYENAPLVIQEAFATRTPVVATNLGGMAEMVSNEVSGLLFERGNVVDLAKQFQRLFTEPGLLERLKAGAPKVKTIEEEVDELEKIYFDLTHGKMKFKESQTSYE